MTWREVVTAFLNARRTVASLEQQVDRQRKTIAELEERVRKFSNRLDELSPRVATLDPPLEAFMREGLPLELYTRLSLQAAGYRVHGEYHYWWYRVEDPRIERSVDVYATRESVFTVPEEDLGPPRSGRDTSWPERDHLLVEVKQRRSGVKWLFCYLPHDGSSGSMVPPTVPVMSHAIELRPGKVEAEKPSGTSRDPANGLAQLQQGRIPLSVHVERTALSQRDTQTRDSIRLVLVTDAELYVFEPPHSFSDLESPTPSAMFAKVGWLVCQPEATLSLIHHQQMYYNSFGAGLPVADQRRVGGTHPELLLNETDEVHVVNYHHLDEFLAFVRDPPRIKSIQINLVVDGAPQPLILIK